VLHHGREWPPDRRKLDQAWERFVRGGDLDGVRPEIARSWTRTRDVYRIDPELRRAPVLPPDDLARRLELDDGFAVSAPVIAQFAEGLRGSGHVVALFDATGWMLSLGGDRAAIEGLAEINFCPGASWREDATGTNGPGTALAERRATEVFASEHFVAAWQDWASASVPIGRPGSGEPLALIDVTGPWDSRDPQGLVAATAIAAVIEERLRARESVRREIVRYAMHVARASGEGLIAVDDRGRVLQGNDAAVRSGALENGVLPDVATGRLLAALRRAGPVEEEIVLEWQGEKADRQRAACTVVRHDGRPVGALLRLLSSGRLRAPAPGRPSSPAGRPFEAILGSSPSLAAALHLARVCTRNDLPVVITGETGTGKELFAQGIHAGSARAERPLVALNCGAIPATLIEAELFGYEPGTFTGGQKEGKAGKLEEASGGTLFLDEVSELPPAAQTALLRVLQESEVVRLGGSRTRPVDVRIVAATNRRLDEEVAAGRFRQDLYFRLNVLTLVVPPLRERRDDVPLLARAFLSEAEERTGRTGLSLSDEALEILSAHGWAGNVRELRNVVLRAAAVVAAPPIGPQDLLLVDLIPAQAVAPPRGAGARPDADGGEEAGREELVAVLDASDWNIARTATSLGVSRMTLYRRLRKLGITR
jgi:sigma-54 dependent transcriptional regulator, acetoin dehydrogenase operon transcriptional activator AcoR